MKVGIVGYGRTGKLVASEVIQDTSCELCWVIRKSQKNEYKYASQLLGFDSEEGQIFSLDHIDSENFFSEHPVDVIIDFAAENAVNCYAKAAEMGVKIVSAVSHYDDLHLRRLRKLAKSTAILQSPNITIGINLLMMACQMLNEALPNMDKAIIEQHFKQKELVSGTALRIADSLDVDEEENIHSVRVGETVGKHEVIFTMPHQTIRVVHESHDRGAFGQGAIFAARKLMDMPNGYYTMEELLLSSTKEVESQRCQGRVAH